MNTNSRRRVVVAAGLAAAAFALGACAAGNGPNARPAAAPAALQSAEPPAPESKKESTRAPVTPAPAEFRTPEEAAQHAADPKTPTGAIIIKPPINVMPPDTPPSDPKQ